MNDFPRFLLRLAIFGLIAGLGFGATAVQIDPSGALPSWPAGPGVTVDEGFNVQEGVRLVIGLKAWFRGAVGWREVFGDQKNLGPNPPLGFHLADHPPAGRIWLGLWHQAGAAVLEKPGQPERLVYAYARLGSAAAFALIIFLVGFFSAKWYGMPAGLIAAGSLILMPRVFGHAHLASLETVMNLAYVAAILSVAAWWKPVPNPPPPPDSGTVVFAGILWGLALLTKIQAVLIAPPVVLWTLWYWRRKAFLPLMVWGGLGLLVFFLGWPWLWFDPLDHALDYFRSSTDRAALSTWYFGEKFTDVQTPWHYPFVIFFTTIPVGLLVWGLLGIVGRNAEKRWLAADGRLHLILLACLFPLVLFAIPGVAVYDGARLFLISSPMWAIVIARGVGVSWHWLADKAGSKIAGLVVFGVFASQGYGLWVTSPHYLNYYNLVIGGLAGADAKGMEINYWGDSLTKDYWNEVAERIPSGGTVHVTPVLHPLQLEFLKSQLSMLDDKKITLKPCDPKQLDEVKYLAHFNRKADLAPPIENAIKSLTPEIEVERQGVRLGAFYEFDQTAAENRRDSEE